MQNFARAGYVAQVKQLPFHAAARAADRLDGPTQIGQGGARGGAKSHAAVCQMVHDDCQRVPRLKWLFLRSVGASARESFRDMLAKALPGMMQYYVESRGTLELPNGSRVVLGGFRNERDIDKYIGLEYDGILLDDGHLVSKAKFDQIKGSLRTSKPNWRPRLYVTFNPGGVGHAYLKSTFVQPWREKREADTRFFFSLPEDNAFLNPEYVKYLDGLTGWLHQAWRKGDFDIAAGQFFTTWDYDTHVVKHVLPVHGWRYWLALDYGFAHYTAVYLFGENGDGTLYVLDEHAERGWLVERHAAAVHALLERHGLGVHDLDALVAGADIFSRERDGGTVAEEYAKYGLPWTPANTDRIQGAAEGMRRLGDPAHGIRPTLFIHDRCRRLIECLPALEHDPHRPEDVLKWDTDDEGNGGDDFFDSWRYGIVYASRQRTGYAANPLAGWRG